MIAGGDAFASGVVDDVVLYDGVGGGLDSVVAGVPNNVSFDDVGSLAVGVVDDDTGIVGIMNDIVADDIAVAAVLEFDPVALAHGSAFEIVDVIGLHDRIENVAVGRAVGFVVGTEIEAFAVTTGVVDVVASEGECFVDFASVVGITATTPM